jgi:hypothetical protein
MHPVHNDHRVFCAEIELLLVFSALAGVLAVAADLHAPQLPYSTVFAVAAIALSSVLLVTNFFLLWKVRAGFCVVSFRPTLCCRH